MDPSRATYLEPTQEAGRELFTRGITGPVVMLNLLRFRDIADYSASPDLASPEPISGAEAYRLYSRHTLPFLLEAGGEVIFDGAGGPAFIGPSTERWDRVLLVRHASLEIFRSFASNPGYLAGIGHRLAALEDSRLLPMIDHTRPSRA
ncbi:MAG: DUF1330 domain-containing protein [Acidobacteriota bacterium]